MADKIPPALLDGDASGRMENGKLDSYGADLPKYSPVAPTPPAPKLKYPAAGAVACVAYGMTMITYAMTRTGWTATSTFLPLATSAMLWGGFTEWLGGFFLMLDGQTFASCAHMGYGFFWVGLYHTLIMVLTGNTGLPGDTALTLWLCQWGLFTSALFVCTYKMGPGMKWVFGLLAVTFFLFGAGQHNDFINKLSGYWGCLAGFTAIYAGFVSICDETLGITLPA